MLDSVPGERIGSVAFVGGIQPNGIESLWALSSVASESEACLQVPLLCHRLTTRHTRQRLNGQGHLGTFATNQLIVARCTLTLVVVLTRAEMHFVASWGPIIPSQPATVSFLLTFDHPSSLFGGVCFAQPLLLLLAARCNLCL